VENTYTGVRQSGEKGEGESLMFINIVHISDLQAGKTCLAELKIDGSEGVAFDDRYRHYANVLAEDVQKSLARLPPLGSDIHMLAITGDIANEAQLNEYTHAKCFVEQMVGSLDVDWNAVAIVPGNHDVDWEMLKKKWGESPPRKAADIVECAAIDAKMSNFKKWYNGLHSKRSNYKYVFGRPLEFLTEHLAVVGLDSCERSTHNKAKNQGFVGQPQLKSATEFLNKYGKKKVKIAIIHHNPFVSDDENSRPALYKPSRVKGALGATGCAVILGGHMHRPMFKIDQTYTRSSKKLCHTLIAGPCCMSHEYRKLDLGGYSEPLPNRYQILSINPISNLLVVQLRRFSFERLTPSGIPGDWTEDHDLEYARAKGIFQCQLDPNSDKAKQEWQSRFKGFPRGFPVDI